MLRLFLINIYEMFPMQSSEFTKLLYFENDLKRNWNKIFEKYHLKWIFIDKKIYFKVSRFIPIISNRK